MPVEVLDSPSGVVGVDGSFAIDFYFGHSVALWTQTNYTSVVWGSSNTWSKVEIASGHALSGISHEEAIKQITKS